MPELHPLVRTRLTHTLEVNSIAREMGRALGLVEPLVDAIALGTISVTRRSVTPVKRHWLRWCRAGFTTRRRAFGW